MSTADTIEFEIAQKLRENAPLLNHAALGSIGIKVLLHNDGGRVRRVELDPHYTFEDKKD